MSGVQDYQVPETRDQGAERYLRDNSAERYAATVEKGRKRSRGLRTLLLFVLVAVVAVGAFAFFQSCGITQRPFYMLLLGTDESLARNQDTSEESLQGVYRTDTMILARIDPVEKKATLVSIPRDTQVEIPGYGTQKINAAYAYGGHQMAMQVVSDIAGVPLSHYAVVDMDGLRAVVDAVGGVDVYVPLTIDDPDAEGYLEAGWQTLSGEQALVFCRSRNTYEDFDSPDGMRAANQRTVLQAIANKVLASDPATQANAVTALAEAVSTDLSITDIALLAQAFSGMDTEANLYTGTMPTESIFEDDLWYEIILPDEWAAMMERVDAGLPPTEETIVDDYTGTVISNAGA